MASVMAPQPRGQTTFMTLGRSCIVSLALACSSASGAFDQEWSADAVAEPLGTIRSGLRAGVSAGACAPVEHGVGIDSRAALQTWIDGLCGDLPAGDYYIAAGPDASGAEVGLRVGAGKTLVGPGAALHFIGVVHGDWRGIRVTGDGATIADIELDTGALQTDDEQSHLIEVYLAQGVTIERVVFHHPQKWLPTTPPKGMPGGDCIRFLGRNARDNAPARPAGGVVLHNDFVECDRSGVGIQYETRGLEVAFNTFRSVGDTAFDGEISAGAGSDIYLHNNTMIDPSRKGKSCISLSAQPGPLERVRVSSNRLDGCGLDALNAVGLTIENNHISQDGPDPALALKKGVDDVLVTGNLIERSRPTQHRTVAVTHLNAGYPGKIVLRGNTLRNVGPAAVVGMENPLSVELTDNTVRGEGETAIALNGLFRPVSSVVVTGNQFSGGFSNCLKLVGVASARVEQNLGTPGCSFDAR
jgi:hypothetical protein